MMNKIITAFFLFLSYSSFSQIYEDYLGAGQQIGINVRSSPHEIPDTNRYAISGTTLIPDLVGAARFLSQATLGTNYEEIEHVSTIGIDAWLDEQFALPQSSYMDRYDSLYQEIQLLVTANTIHRPSYHSITFYDCIFNDPDFLRQKIGFALSQILVISKIGDLSDQPERLFGVHDALYQGSFGNFRDMLGNVTYSYGMASYLSYFNNRRADVVGNTLPDENYAREIMQLFSIGLIKLNIDGTPLKDSNGDNIPTYDIENIEALAKVFTGLTLNGDERLPLIVNDDFHSIGSKHIIDDEIIPSGQTGAEDVEQALDVLFNHPNVGPFIGMRLIQQLVKSNPTPAYIKRVAMVFNDNGLGERGDLKSVIKAILLDPEARNCDWIDDPENGKLIQPVERFVTLYKAFDISSPTGVLWMDDVGSFGSNLFQAFQRAPTVFNFFSPFHAEDKVIAPLGLRSPEFQILDNITSINYLNILENRLKGEEAFLNLTKSNTGNNLNRDTDNKPFLDFTDEISVYQNEGIEALLDRLDILICRGQLSQGVKDIIIDTINENIINVNGYDETNIMHDVLYYIFLSPDYIIQK